MTVKAESLSRATAVFSASNYDVAAGLSEATLTDFLDAHWKTESTTTSSVYKGTGRAAELALEWSYDVTAPATIDLMPIDPTRFARIYRGWLTTVPELKRYLIDRAKESEPNERGELGAVPPPNVRINVPKLNVVIKTDSGVTVSFDYALTIIGVIQIEMAGNQRVLRITPISAKVTDAVALSAAIKAAMPAAPSAMATDCVALEKLILYILNVLIANRIGSFVRQFSLPVAIDVVNGVTVSDVEIEIVDDLLVLMGRISAGPAPAATLAATLAFNGDHHEVASHGADAQKGESTVFARPTDVIPVVDLKAAKALGSWPQRGLFIILHERLFQAFAATVGINESHERCTSIAIFKACYGYAVRIWGATATVNGNGVDVQAQFAGSGWIKGCIETHCKDECAKISFNPSADPKFGTEFSIVGRDLWMTATPRMFDIHWNVGGLPWPINKIIGWVLDQLSDIAVAIIRLLGLQWKKQLTSFPAIFPGTTIGFDPKLDRQIIKDPSQPALMILGEVDFTP